MKLQVRPIKPLEPPCYKRTESCPMRSSDISVTIRTVVVRPTGILLVSALRGTQTLLVHNFLRAGRSCAARFFKQGIAHVTVETLRYGPRTITLKVLAIHLVFQVFSLFVGFSLLELRGLNGLVFGVIAIALMPCAYWYVAVKHERAPAQELRLSALLPRERAICLTALLGATILLVVVFANATVGDLGEPRSGESSARDELLFVLRMVLLLSIFEELIFRGIISRWLIRHISVKKCTVVQSGLFVGVHSLNAPLSSGDFLLMSAFIMFCFTSGVAFFLLFYRTGSLLLPIVFHIAWNAGAFSVVKTAASSANAHNYAEFHLYCGAVLWTVVAILLWRRTFR